MKSFIVTLGQLADTQSAQQYIVTLGQLADTQSAQQYRQCNDWLSGKENINNADFNIAMLLVCPCVSVCSI